jgi:hypothetical protein
MKKRLELKKVTLRDLDEADLSLVQGGTSEGDNCLTPGSDVVSGCYTVNHCGTGCNQ